MAIEVRKTGRINILQMSGKITIGPATAELRDRFRELVDAGEKLFIFDLSRVRLIDSAGVGEVVACQKRVAESEGKIKIVLVSKSKPEEVFVITCLDRVFEIFRSEEEALAAFAT